MPKNCILFLNENPLPPVFTQGTIAGKELRLRSALESIDEVHVLSRQGASVHDPGNTKIGPLEQKVHIHLLPPWPYYLASLPLFVYGFYLAVKLKPRLVEAESPIISGPAAVLIGKILGINSIVEVRASYDELIKQKLVFVPHALKKWVLDVVAGNTLKYSDAVVANSALYQKQLKQKGVPSTVINPGLQYVPKNPCIPAKRKFPTIGYLGRLAPEKGIDTLIRAFAQLKNQTATLEIAGEGPHHNYLINLCKQLGISDRVRFLGFQPNFSVLQRWDVMVNPNNVKHPLEMVNAEAAYMGVPVICFGTGEYPETVIDNVTGIKVAVPTVEALAKSIDYLISNPKVCYRMAKQARSVISSKYLFEEQVLKLSKLYTKLRS